MDFVSLSPSDDDLFRRGQDHHSSEADNFPVTYVPETPIPVARKPSRNSKMSSKSTSVSSMVCITIVRPTTPPCLPAQPGTESRRCCSLLTPFPPRGKASLHFSDNTGKTTRRSQHHHTPVRSPLAFILKKSQGHTHPACPHNLSC